MNKRHRKICKEAKLPASMTFAGFRHGSATELGDASVADIRPITGHLQFSMTAIYRQLSRTKAATAAAARLCYIQQLSETVSENSPRTATK